MTHHSHSSTPDFVPRAAEAVREHLAAATGLPDFLAGAGNLTLAERRLIVDQALLMLDQNYVHLPLKAAMHAVNPVQRLRVMSRRLERQTEATKPVEWLFHAEMSEIFHSVRDLHTNYLLPDPYRGKIAFLPFLVERYEDAQGEHFMVTHVAQGFSAPGFAPGAEITHWSGIPIAKAVDLNAARFAGSNAAARRSRGIQSLTLRPLAMHLPPFEEWVTVSYIEAGAAAGAPPRELRETWRIVDNALLPPFTAAAAPTGAELAQGLDLDMDEANRAKVMLFAPKVVARQKALEAGEAAPEVRAGEIPTSMPKVFRAQEVQTAAGTFGYIRIFTFNELDVQGFINEFIRLLGEVPDSGLILDVRDNGGGVIWNSELALQTLTPRHITPEPTQFINTPLNLRICRQNQDQLGAWLPSMEQAVEIGAAYSGAVALTPEDKANMIGQQYFGPVVLITSARCYSATDIFAAGFQDHRIGPVLGTDENTGAGGANVWEHKHLVDLLAGDSGTPYRPLPKGAGMRVAIRRSLRVGANSGTPVEDLGITPDIPYRMTRRDLLEGNADLFERAGQVLKGLTPHALSITDATAAAGGALRLKVKATNIDRLDVYVDQRPRASVDLSDGQADVTVPDAATAHSARVEGFASGELVASNTAQLN
ncbi:S41 family peptidase [Streptomyces sp. NPDC029216]|uniref:S41 family peptidase n=1 Tax=Streptomyces sp. NPDC029216 TaxID=3154701 RepID=UPI0033E9DFBD